MTLLYLIALHQVHYTLYQPTMTQSARLAQLVNELTQVRVQSYSLEVQLHSQAESSTQASILPRSVK